MMNALNLTFIISTLHNHIPSKLELKPVWPRLAPFHGGVPLSLDVDNKMRIIQESGVLGASISLSQTISETIIFTLQSYCSQTLDGQFLPSVSGSALHTVPSYTDGGRASGCPNQDSRIAPSSGAGRCHHQPRHPGGPSGVT